MVVSVAMSPCPVVVCPDRILLPRHVTPRGGLRWNSHRGSTNTWNFWTGRKNGEWCIVVSCHWRASLNERLIYCIVFFSLYDQEPKITPSLHFPFSLSAVVCKYEYSSSMCCCGANIWLIYCALPSGTVSNYCTAWTFEVLLNPLDYWEGRQ